MTTASNFSREGSLIVESDAREVHLWRNGAEIALNIEERDGDEQDLIVSLSAQQARDIAAALSTAAHEVSMDAEKADKAREAAADAAQLKARMYAAPVIGDIVIISNSPSALAKEEREGHTGDSRFSGRWGEVEVTNYGADATGRGSEMRAYVTVTNQYGVGMSEWIHVDYLTYVAVMARTRATATNAEATVTAEDATRTYDGRIGIIGH